MLLDKEILKKEMMMRKNNEKTRATEDTSRSDVSEGAMIQLCSFPKLKQTFSI